MALIIETGAGVANANSYATVEQAKAYAAARGLVLPAPDSAIEPLLILAADFLESYEGRYKGKKTAPDNALAWPRSGAVLYDGTEDFPDDAIPNVLIKAQCQLAYDATLTELQATGSGQEVIREKVDVIETEYAKNGSGTVQAEFNKAESILEPLLESGEFSVRTIRV
jgi:hypothetical protein